MFTFMIFHSLKLFYLFITHSILNKFLIYMYIFIQKFLLSIQSQSDKFKISFEQYSIFRGIGRYFFLRCASLGLSPGSAYRRLEVEKGLFFSSVR